MKRILHLSLISLTIAPLAYAGLDDPKGTADDKETAGKPHPAWSSTPPAPVQTYVADARTGQPLSASHVPDPEWRLTPDAHAPRAPSPTKRTPDAVPTTQTQAASTSTSVSTQPAAAQAALDFPHTPLLLRLMDPTNTNIDTQPRVVGLAGDVPGVVDIFRDEKPVHLDADVLTISGIPGAQTFLQTFPSSLLVHAAGSAPTHALHRVHGVLHVPELGVELLMQPIGASAVTLTYAGNAPTSTTRLEHVLSFPNTGVYLWQQKHPDGTLRSITTVGPWPTGETGPHADARSVDSGAIDAPRSPLPSMITGLTDPTAETWIQDIIGLFQGVRPVPANPHNLVVGIPGAQIFERFFGETVLYLAYAGDTPTGNSRLKHMMSSPQNGLHVWRYMSGQALRALVFLTPHPVTESTDRWIIEDNDGEALSHGNAVAAHHGPPPPYSFLPAAAISAPTSSTPDGGTAPLMISAASTSAPPPEVMLSDEELAAHIQAEEELAERQAHAEPEETHAAQMARVFAQILHENPAPARETDEEAARRLRPLVLAQIEHEQEEKERLKEEQRRAAWSAFSTAHSETPGGRVVREVARIGEQVRGFLGNLGGKKKKGGKK